MSFVARTISSRLDVLRLAVASFFVGSGISVNWTCPQLLLEVPVTTVVDGHLMVMRVSIESVGDFEKEDIC